MALPPNAEDGASVLQGALVPALPGWEADVARHEGRPVTDEQFAEIVPSLERLPIVELRLGNTSIGDGSMLLLHRFKSLDTLDIGGTRVTDDGLRHLYRCGSLAELHSDRSQITPAARKHFAGEVLRKDHLRSATVKLLE